MYLQKNTEKGRGEDIKCFNNCTAGHVKIHHEREIKSIHDASLLEGSMKDTIF